MSNPRFSMFNICSSLVLSFLCCFLWDSAKGGQVGLRENMLFSHTKNNHHHLITAFRNTSVSCFRTGIFYCHRCAFCCSHSTKTHTKSHPFCQIGILWKALLPMHALNGCQSFVVKFSDCPVALTTLQLSLARAHLMVLPVPCWGLSAIPSIQGNSWLRGGEEFAESALESAFVHYKACIECLGLPSVGHQCLGLQLGWGWDPWWWSFLQQGCLSAEPWNVHTYKTSVFSYLHCYWSRKSLAGHDWWYCAA